MLKTDLLCDALSLTLSLVNRINDLFHCLFRQTGTKLLFVATIMNSERRVAEVVVLSEQACHCHHAVPRGFCLSSEYIPAGFWRETFSLLASLIFAT
jgi:hypothetical protein